MFPHGNTQCPDEQNVMDRSGSDLNVAVSRTQLQYTFVLRVGAHQHWVS